MWKRSLLLLVLGVSLRSDQVVHSFVVGPTLRVVDSSCLPAIRQPRRNLKKRKGRERKSPSTDFSGDHQQDPNEVIETKPMIAAQRKEAGEDFWIDPKEQKRENQRQQAIANRKASEGEITQEKLRSEVVAPYTQNWIGIISVLCIVLATIVKNFPEVLENPTIGFPDLDAGDPIPLQSTLNTAANFVTDRLTAL